MNVWLWQQPAPEAHAISRLLLTSTFAVAALQKQQHAGDTVNFANSKQPQHIQLDKQVRDRGAFADF